MPTLEEVMAALSAKPKEPESFKLSDAIADPMCAPFGWQSATPDDMFRRGDPVGGSLDLDRVLALPKRAPFAELDPVTVEAIVELEMAKYSRGERACSCKRIDPQLPACIKRLLPAQAWMLREISLNQGLLAHMTVGAGKTMCNILAPLALAGVKKAVVLIPPSLVDQIQHDYLLIAEHFIVPGLIMHIGNRAAEVSVTYPDRPTLHVLPYSRLSMPEESDFLVRLQPDAIICDEVDSVRSMQSSRGIRLAKWYMGGGPEERARRMATKFLGWTGSLTDHSVTEFNWLALFALRERSPLPLDPTVVEEWGRCLDATLNPSPPGELLQFCEPGEDVRHAFRRRLAWTPGFVVANVSGVEVTGGEGQVKLDIRARQAPELPPIIDAALKMVRSGERPDTLIREVRPDLADVAMRNEELKDALAIAQAAQEVSVGVLNFWKFPNGEPEWLIKDWLGRRADYNRASREQSMKGETFLDSAMLCEHAAMRHWGDHPKRDDRPEWNCPEWPAWRDIRDKVKPVTDSCVLHDFLVLDAIEWAQERPGIVWYGLRAFASRMQQLSGLPVHDGGPHGGKLLRRERGDRSIICSIKSNGRGRNGLQYVFDRQLVINPMASATGWEQLAARTHRRGQMSSGVSIDVYEHTPELRKAIAQAIRRSKYVQDLLGSEQKLLIGGSTLDTGAQGD